MSYLCHAASALLALTCFAASLPCFGQESASSPLSTAASEAQSAPSNELAVIRAGSKAFTDAFNQHDAKAIADLWTPEGQYVDDAGQRYLGRQAIEECYAQYFTEQPQTKIRIVVDSLRLLSDNATVEEGRSILQPPPVGEPGVGTYTAVHVKVDGKWLIGTVNERWSATPSTYQNVADLEWLIGTWTANEHGAASKSVCKWIANKSFVQRSYTATAADGSQTSGQQIIGWNPQEGYVQSWNFSSDGGHAVGVWTPIEGGWMAEIQGTAGDGVPTTAINVLKRLDDNAYVWQSFDRVLGEVALPDTDEVVIRRSSTDD